MPATEPVGLTNLITVDLSPLVAGCWGDCARSFVVEKGQLTTSPALPEFVLGKSFLEDLHEDVMGFINEDTTFHELFAWTNARIDSAGFENLDFQKNVGHSIAKRLQDRVYVMTGNHMKLAQVPFFTFEPHLRVKNQQWGFKHENILFFGTDGKIEVL